ncbi:hypothetical protein Tco_1434422, partial [Tanacetum coccineum]
MKIKTWSIHFQIALAADPFNCELRTEEAAYAHAFNDALLMEEWSRIEAVMESDGTLLTNDQVAAGFVKHYEDFLGQAGHTGVFNMDGLFRNVLDNETAVHMVRAVSVNEVKEAMFSMGNDKSPGPD